jgi:hypothetical protein
MLKKTSLAAVFGAVAFLAAGAAMAEAPTAELKVIGTLEVPSCSVDVDSDGVYDFGNISPTIIKPGTTTTALEPITKTWTVNCSGPTVLTFEASDNRTESSSSTDSKHFGLGHVNDTGKIGYYMVNMSNAEVSGADGEMSPAKVFVSNTSTISNAANVDLNGGANYKMGWTNTSNTLQEGQIFKADLQVTPTLAGTTTMNGPITDHVDLDGSLTLTFSFGLR